MSDPLSTPEIKALRARAAAGEILPTSLIARFVAATRKSFLALGPVKAAKALSGPKNPVTQEKDVDFF